jgi:4-carboxymuconolactone decarboxylase
MAPRIAPVPPTGNRPDIQELLDLSTEGTGGAANVVLTLARNPGLFRRFVPFSGKLLVAGKLPPAKRELLILRTAWLCASEYEWGQHVRIGLEAGLSDDEIDRIPGPLDRNAWTLLDYTLLQATDELVGSHCIERPTWDVLAEYFDEQQLIELVMVIGTYVMIAGFLNSLEVEREPDVAGFPSPAGRRQG